VLTTIQVFANQLQMVGQKAVGEELAIKLEVFI